MPMLIATAWIRPLPMPGCCDLGRCAKRGVGSSSPTSSDPNKAITAPEAPTDTVSRPAGSAGVDRISLEKTLKQLATRPPAR